METGFVFFTIIVLAVAFTVFHGNNPPMQLPGQRTAQMPGTTAPALSDGLKERAGIPAREYK